MNHFSFQREEFKKKSSEKVNNILASHDRYYIFEISEISEMIVNFLLSNGKEVIGFISSDSRTRYLNLPIIQINEANHEVPIFSSALLRVIQSNKLLKRIGFDLITDYFELNLYNESLFKFPTIDNIFSDIETNYSKYEWLFSLLEDDLSKQILEAVLNMRFNNQLNPMLKQNVNKQYFDVLSNYDNIDVFVDCGGYHGETSVLFITKNPNYKKIYFFEPFPEALLIAKKKLEGYNVEFIEKAVYNTDGILKLTTNREDGNTISLNGDISIKTCTMDEALLEKIDYIKLDIEGSELNALYGAERIIKKFQPIITVAIYHKQSHFWEIPQYLLSLMPESKVYIRHNNDGIYETILHVIPNRFYTNL